MLIQGRASASDDVIDELYGKLEEMVPYISSKEITLVNGDFKNSGWRKVNQHRDYKACRRKIWNGGRDMERKW